MGVVGIDWQPRDGWEPICSALGIPVPDIAVPHANTSDDFQKCADERTLSLGMALLIAAVIGGVVVAIAGIARVTQLRLNARRIRRSTEA